MTPQQLQEVFILFDVSIALLVFGVGLPSLIFDRPAYLRRVRERHSKISKHIPHLTTLILTGIVIWLGFYLIEPYFMSWCVTPTRDFVKSICKAREWMRRYSDLISFLLISIGIILTVWVWIILRTYRFQYVLRRLERELLGKSWSARLGQLTKGISPRLSLNRPSRIELLGILGQNSATQSDKAEVLWTLSRIAAPFNPSTDIEEIQQFVDSVLATLELANLTNYLTGITILGDLALKINKDKNNNQLPAIVAGLMQLGAKEWNFGAEQIYQRLLAIFQSLEVFEPCQILCADAITRRLYGSAVALIAYLDEAASTTLAAGYQIKPLDGDGNPVILYIGTLAKTITVSGEFSEWAKDRLFITFGGNKPDLLKWCNHAIDYYRDQRADFDTATYIRRGIISILDEQANPHPQ